MGSTVFVARIADVEVVGSLEVLVIVIDRCLGFLYLLGICKRGFIILEKRVPSSIKLQDDDESREAKKNRTYGCTAGHNRGMMIRPSCLSIFVLSFLYGLLGF